MESINSTQIPGFTTTWGNWEESWDTEDLLIAIWDCVWFIFVILPVFIITIISNPFAKHKPVDSERKLASILGNPKRAKISTSLKSPKMSNSGKNTSTSVELSANASSTTTKVNLPLSPTVSHNNQLSVSVASFNTSVGSNDSGNDTGNNSNSKKRSVQRSKNRIGNGKEDLSTWRLGMATSIMFVSRQFTSCLSWLSWIITLDYREWSSISFMCDFIVTILNAFSVWLLYLYFIWRLYRLYNGEATANIISKYNIRIYIVLFLINLGLLGSMLVPTYTWIWWDSLLISRSHIVGIILELIMVVWISILFSKPMIVLSAKSHRLRSNITHFKKSDNNNDSNSDNSNKNNIKMIQDKLLNLSTKLLVLSGIAFGSTIIAKLFIIVGYEYCYYQANDSTCWVIFVSFALWPIDAFTNILCIFFAFKHGTKYYYKFCGKLHKCVLFSCVAKCFHKSLDTSQSK